MKKIKIYLDTSVISHLKQEDAFDKMQDTLKFWEELKQEKYEIIISNITLDELNKCPEPKRTLLYEYLSDINYTELDENENIINLAHEYIKHGVLTQKSFDDCRHIAFATITECKFIVSWNFKHIVNYKTIHKVQAINKFLEYNEIEILPPSMLLEGDD